MDFESLLEIVADEPVFETGLLLAGDADPTDIRRQLTRWTKAGRLLQLRRGLYALAPPFRNAEPHPFTIANCMVRGSYVSCQSALAYYDHIPETVHAITSVSATRPGRWDTALGTYLFHHIKVEYLSGYELVDFSRGQQAFVATPEKALLDLVYLTPRSDTMDYLVELRLQNLGKLDMENLLNQAQVFNRPKQLRAARFIETMARSESLQYETE